MFYHAKVEMGFGQGYVQWNLDKDTLMREIIIPFINKQIKVLSFQNGSQITNLGMIRQIQVFKTETELTLPTQFLFDMEIENILACTQETVFKELKKAFKNQSNLLSNNAKLVSFSEEGGVITDGKTIYIVKAIDGKVKIEKLLSDKCPTELNDKEFLLKNNCTEEIIQDQIISSSDFRTRSLLQKSFTVQLNQIFVIMKFGDDYLDSAYEGVIKPLGNNYGYDVLRIDEIQDSGRITDQVIESIANSRLVIADLSGERPNCYYEAGFAHAIGKEIIFTIKEGSSIHFDLAGYRFIEWDTENDLRNKLKERLESIKNRSTSLNIDNTNE